MTNLSTQLRTYTVTLFKAVRELRAGEFRTESGYKIRLPSVVKGEVGSRHDQYDRVQFYSGCQPLVTVARRDWGVQSAILKGDTYEIDMDIPLGFGDKSGVVSADLLQLFNRLRRWSQSTLFVFELAVERDVLRFEFPDTRFRPQFAGMTATSLVLHADGRCEIETESLSLSVGVK